MEKVGEVVCRGNFGPGYRQKSEHFCDRAKKIEEFLHLLSFVVTEPALDFSKEELK